MSGNTLDEFAEGIWTVSAPFKIAGAEFGTRMMVIRLSNGQLVLIAPCPIDDALAAKILALGPVGAIVAPNGFHYLFLTAALERFPEAIPFLAEGVAEKLGGAPAGARTLTGEPDALWKADLEHCEIPGAPKVNEIVFYHAASKTLVLTDLCFNFNPAPGGWTGFFLRVFGAHGKLSVSRLMRSFLKDRTRLRSALDQILEWDFDRIIVTHGANIGSGADAKKLFGEATADL